MAFDDDILTDEELLEYEKLLLEEGLKRPSQEESNPNYLYLHECFHKGLRGCVLEGSSRSGKTWSWIDFVFYICLFVETECTINIYRLTYNEFKTTLYDDFKRQLDRYQLPNKFHGAEEIKSFKIGKNKINFIGCDKVSKAHGAGCDYAIFNEGIFIPQEIFKQALKRCRKFWIIDYNPSVTEHWIYDTVLTRPDAGYLKTTFRDNKHVSDAERDEILATEPWLPGSYEVIDNDVYYQGKIVNEKNNPPPHPENVKNGTADEFDWRVYGLGLRGSMKGAIFTNVKWIDEFPKDKAHFYSNDFGFTNDPNVLVKYAEDKYNIWIEPLSYHPIDNAEDLAAYFEAVGVQKDDLIACDSSDKYTGENKGTIEMVRGLKKLGYSNAFKISKTKSVVFWITSMKKKKIHIVKNHLYKYAKIEQEKYRWKEINGICINQPIDQSNHIWDSGRYGHIAYNNPRVTELKTDKETLQKINY